MAFSNLSLFGSAFFTPIIVGKMTHTIGWPWTFYFVAIFAGVVLPLVILFVPETTYRRPTYLETDIASTDNMRSRDSLEPSVELHGSDKAALKIAALDGKPSRDKELDYQEDGRVNDHTNHTVPEKVNFARSLLPFNGRKTDERFFKLLLRPFPLFLHPAILWVRKTPVHSSIGSCITELERRHVLLKVH